MEFRSFVNKKNSIISKGEGLDPNFWQNFRAILTNSEEVAELLGVTRSKVITWREKIQNAIEDNNKQKKINFKNRVIKTGKII